MGCKDHLGNVAAANIPRDQDTGAAFEVQLAEGLSAEHVLKGDSFSAYLAQSY